MFTCTHKLTDSDDILFFSLPKWLFLLLFVLLFFGFDAGSLEGADGGNSSGISFFFLLRCAVGLQTRFGLFCFLDLMKKGNQGWGGGVSCM